MADVSLRARFTPMLGRLIIAGFFFVTAGVAGWFSLVYTVHLGTVSVPELRGLSDQEAEKLAHDIGLVVEYDTTGAFSATIAPGLVAAQNPLPGFHVKTGSIVRVNRSLGDEEILVPSVRGESPQVAIRAFEAAGLKPGRRAEVFGQGGADSVLETEPTINTTVPPDAEIDLLTNRSPAQALWVMPSLLTRHLTLVRRFCDQHRFRIGRVHEVDYPGITPGLVLRQYPPAGSPVSRSDIITLWISR